MGRMCGPLALFLPGLHCWLPEGQHTCRCDAVAGHAGLAGREKLFDSWGNMHQLIRIR